MPFHTEAERRRRAGVATVGGRTRRGGLLGRLGAPSVVPQAPGIRAVAGAPTAPAAPRVVGNGRRVARALRPGSQAEEDAQALAPTSPAATPRGGATAPGIGLGAPLLEAFTRMRRADSIFPPAGGIFGGL